MNLSIFSSLIGILNSIRHGLHLRKHDKEIYDLQYQRRANEAAMEKGLKNGKLDELASMSEDEDDGISIA